MITPEQIAEIAHETMDKLVKIPGNRPANYTMFIFSLMLSHLEGLFYSKNMPEIKNFYLSLDESVDIAIEMSEQSGLFQPEETEVH